MGINHEVSNEDALLIALGQFHTTLRGLGVDMDLIQKQVHDSIPKFSVQNGLIVWLTAFCFWTVLYFFVHNFLVLPINKRSKEFRALSKSQKLYYTTYIHGIYHGLFAFTGAIYCFLYADGVAGTTWAHCNFFKLTMFDLQKYLGVISSAWMALDFLICLST
jgi:hypothetical protein